MENKTQKHMSAYFEKKEREEKDGTRFAQQKAFGQKVARGALAIAEIDAKYRSELGLTPANKRAAAKAAAIRAWLNKK